MKEMSKVKAYMKKSLASILSEKNILANLHFPLIANLNFSFQDKEYLYLILDYLAGGDLRYYIRKRIIFNESQIKFIISNLLLSLRYIHSNNIIHRDIKPENLVFDEKGYMHLTDFGISRKIRKGKNILDKSGTPGYISPEVLLNKPQNFDSDYFSVGVICYELLFKKKPFKGKNKKEVAEKILYKNIGLTKKNIPKNYSIIFGDFINKLLKRNCRDRLGHKGIQEIMNHPWLEGVEWDLIEEKYVLSENIPFSPSIGDNFDETSANKKEVLDMEHYDEYLEKVNESNYFQNFYFNYLDMKKNKSSQEKSNISNKNTSNTEGFKNTQSEGDLAEEAENEFNNISMVNPHHHLAYFKLNSKSTNFDNNSEQFQNNNCTCINNTNKLKFHIKANTIITNRNKIYEKEYLDEINRANLFKDYSNNAHN